MSVAAALGCLPLLALFALFAGRLRHSHAVVYAGCLWAALALAGSGLTHLAAPEEFAPKAVLPLGLPWISAHFRLDSLSAFFMIVVNVSAAAASLFGIGYGSHVPEKRRVTPLFPLFLFAMNTVLVADDAFTFLVSWEFMSLSSWLLVLSDHRRPENRHAAMIYLVMAVFGTFCLLPAFGLLAGGAGHYTFAAMRAAELAPVPAFLLVLFALLGTGSKAGLVPLHAWLPLAHPAAPSHVSALMSGVMTKVALYGMIRLLFDLHGEVPWQWGAAMMLAGAVTAVLGVLYAVMQTDLKKLLAFSTIENVGVIVIGLGLALAFKDKGEAALAALALVAGLYHALNHSVFKSLLFLGSGAVLTATGEREIGRLGGLLKRMPVTGTTFLVGAAAISALPPLNGFVSEWLILQSLFKGPSLPEWTMKFGVPVVGALLALAAALAAACFVRAFGITFLGRARAAVAAQAREVDPTMRAALIALAVLCVLLGVFPVTVTGGLALVVQPLAGVALPPSADLGWPWLSPAGANQGSYSATVVMFSGAVLMSLAVFTVHRWGTRALRRAPAWDCGHREDIPDAQYTPESMAQPLRRVFGATLFSAREAVDMPMPGDMSPARFSVETRDPLWQGLYEPVARWLNAAADQANRLQFLTVRR
jgi:formate hydrogenlyase subunit 3/multisubunit Na+/H+ antiporter MnhD subunit